MAAQLPTKMKAIQLQEFHKGYQLAEIDVPTPKPHQVLVKIAAGGFCHTDCMVLEHEFTTTLPVVGSHEPAGTVVAVGSDVNEFKTGDRVGCINFDSCCGKTIYNESDGCVTNFACRCLPRLQEWKTNLLRTSIDEGTQCKWRLV